jgi:hypothetical protein
MAGEIWHLSIEDLFQPVQEAPRLGGDGPFVINLSVSTAPISVPTKALTNSPLDAHVYQIQVTEDGRTRFRLRFGPFASEDQADAILAEVRDTYPGALTATASASDLRVIETMQAKAGHRQAAPKAAELVIEKTVSRKIAAEKPAPEAAEKAKPQKAAGRDRAVLPKAATAAGPAPQPKAEIPEISIDMAWPTPELGVPPLPLRAAPSVATQPQWSLPELDVPLPPVHKQPAAAIAPVAKETAAPAPMPKPFELKIAPPFSMAGEAPVLTEVVTPFKSHAAKSPAPKPPVIAAPVLTEAVEPVAPKGKAPSPAPSGAPPVAPSAAPQPVAAATAAGPLSAPPMPESAPVLKQELAPAPKKAIASPPKPLAPPPKLAATPPQHALPPKQVLPSPKPAPPKPAPPKTAAPKIPAPVEAVKAAPVLTQSVAPARKGWAKLRAFSSKPMATKLTSLQHVVVATAPAPPPREVKKLDEPLESLESTQTMRALTPTELEDNEASRWFVIQLALADHAFDPDSVPNLDIFREYRLYSVAGLDQGRVVHALRLGFFREEIGAVAVASYLAAYWDKPTIKRVSVAERERFAEQRVEARKDVGATGKHAVIEITDELVARRRRSNKAAASKPSHRPIEH